MSLNLKSIEATNQWNEAEVFGEFGSKQHLNLLQQQIPVLRGLSATQQADQWRMWTPTYGELIEKKLSRHRQSASKDGQALVFAEGVANDKFYLYGDGRKFPVSGRKIEDIRAITCAAFDVDNGTKLADAHEAMLRSGLAGVCYTTYTHGKTVSEIKVDVTQSPERARELAIHEAQMAGLAAINVLSVSDVDEFG